MAISRMTSLSLALLLLLLPSSSKAQNATVKHESARQFVQQFYDWYVPVALGDTSEPSAQRALTQRPRDFSPRLASALSADYAAQAKASEIVGIDFDPFLNSQDPCEHYNAGIPTRKKGSYLIAVFSVCSGKESATPSLIAVLVLRRAHWQFTNFYYPDQLQQFPQTADLLSLLHKLRRSRERPVQ